MSQAETYAFLAERLGYTATQIRATIADGVEPGNYTLKVYTHSGFGSEFGVKTATTARNEKQRG